MIILNCNLSLRRFNSFIPRLICCLYVTESNNIILSTIDLKKVVKRIVQFEIVTLETPI